MKKRIKSGKITQTKHVIEHGDSVYIGDPESDDWICIEWRTVGSLSADNPESVTMSIRGSAPLAVLSHSSNTIGVELVEIVY